MNELHLTQALVPYEIAARWRKDGGFTDSYAWHKRAWDCFPGRPDSARDFLTRLDDTGAGFRLMVLSPMSPTRPEWCPEANWQTKPVAESFLSHPRYRFSLLANPTRKIRSNAKGELLKNGRRVPLSRHEDLIAWLERKAGQHGFLIAPDQIRIIPRPDQMFLKGGRGGLHGATEFTGALQVTSPELLRQTFTSGIGSAKAFGFGMLCLAPF